jgi:hypothetical protein
MTTRCCCAFLLALAALGAPQARAQEPARVLRMVSVRELASPAPEHRAPPFGSFLGFASDSEASQPLLGPGPASLQPGDIAALVGQLRESLQVSISNRGSVLMLTGAEDDVRQAEGLVDRLRAAMVREIRLDAALYRLATQQAFPAVATADALARLTAGLPRVWSASATVHAGMRAALASTRLTSYVRDVEGEVAQDSQIADPKVDRAFEGVHVLIEPHSLVRSKELVLIGQFAFGERRGPFENRRTGVKDHPSIDVPFLDVNSGTFSGRLAEGGALLVGVRSAHAYASNLLLTVQATATEPGAQPADDIAIFPVSALISGALRSKSRPVQGALSPLEFVHDEAAEDYFGPRNTDELLATLEESGLQEGYRAERGGYLIVRGTAAERELAADVLQSFQDRWLRTVQVETETLLLGATDGGVFSADDAMNAPGELLHGVSFPALLGRSHAIVSGRETTTVADFDVEIAQEARFANPTVRPLFDGMLLSCLPYPGAAQGAIGAQLELEVFHTLPTERRALEMLVGGDLYLPQTSAARFAHDGSLVAGRDLVLGAAPEVRVGARPQRTAQILRISTR